jgi:rare lipoprotein A
MFAMLVRVLILSITAVALTVSAMAHAQDDSEPAAVNTPAPALASIATDTFEGNVSYYGRELAGRRTSSGERFDPATLTMAHKTLPFGTWVRVTNLRNNLSVIVRVNDRGPHTAGRVGDVSASAAQVLDMLRAGVVRARLEVLRATDAEKLK